MGEYLPRFMGVGGHGDDQKIAQLLIVVSGYPARLTQLTHYIRHECSVRCVYHRELGFC